MSAHFFEAETTLERAEATREGRHLVKRYEGKVVWVGRYATPAGAQEALAANVAWKERWDRDNPDLPRPWEYEVL